MDERHRHKLCFHLDDLVAGTDDDQFNGLLEIFQHRKILNDWMIEKINNAQNSKRTFYEMVPKRGPKVYEQLLQAFSDVGLVNLRNLLEGNSLNGNVSESNSPSIANGHGGHTADGNMLCVAKKNLEDVKLDFNKNNVDKNAEEYVVKSKPKGIVLLINNNVFPFKTIKEQVRLGSENDVQRLKKILTNLGFEVKVKTDFTKKEFEDYMNIFIQKERLKQVDSLLLFVMSHGTGSPSPPRNSFNIECKDSLFVESDYVINQFSSVNCPNLAGKPKVIFFQACRGGNHDHGMTIPYIDSIRILTTDYSVDAVEHYKMVPTFSDMLLVYSTSPGFVSYRRPDGGYFTQELCNVLEEKQGLVDIKDLIDQVSRNLKRIYQNLQVYQVVHVEHFGFDKHFLV